MNQKQLQYFVTVYQTQNIKTAQIPSMSRDKASAR